MKKILVIFTGGTIGSKITDQIINVDKESPFTLIHMYEKKYGDKGRLEGKMALSILSENTIPDHWSKLCSVLSEISYENYKGVILTHGSDTLAYTSALVGMLYHYVPVPVVLVASNYALGEKGSNGLKNFKKAVDFIDSRTVRGVFTIYRNHKNQNEVFLSTRMMEADPYSDQFRAFGGHPYGIMKKDRFIPYTDSYQPSIDEINKKQDKTAKEPIVFTNRILLIRPYPGIDYSMFDLLSGKPAAVLHYLYHSATACTDAQEETYQVLSLVKRRKEEGIDFYAASYKESDGKRYATADALLKAGAIPLYNISAEAAYAKLMILYNRKQPVTKEEIQKNFYFESLPG